MKPPLYQRADGRQANELRAIKIVTACNPYAEGSCQFQMGKTLVYCTASIEEKVPKHVKKGGWVTAEYAMLPRATHQRQTRDRAPSAPNSRSSEIGRLIGRTLRAMVDLSKLGERTLTIDCDVIQADGGTRCAAINGGALALAQAIGRLMQEGRLCENPIRSWVGAVSVVLHEGAILLDPDYQEDSTCDMDMNVAMNAQGAVIELQSSCEGDHPSPASVVNMIDIAGEAINRLGQIMQPYHPTFST